MSTTRRTSSPDPAIPASAGSIGDSARAQGASMKHLLAGGVLVLAALGLQLAMVVRVIEPDVVLSLGGYAGLFAGMALFLAGILRRRR